MAALHVAPVQESHHPVGLLGRGLSCLDRGCATMDAAKTMPGPAPKSDRGKIDLLLQTCRGWRQVQVGVWHGEVGIGAITCCVYM